MSSLATSVYLLRLPSSHAVGWTYPSLGSRGSQRATLYPQELVLALQSVLTWPPSCLPNFFYLPSSCCSCPANSQIC